ncbi:MFS transporter [Candidatus Gottesmanbacteria bacterium]|nr:MFS transporter [Candidatus Gottesmanbacteria bacterium]
MKETTSISFRGCIAISPFRYLWFGQICSQLAVNTTLFTLALILYRSTGSNTAVSILFLSYGIPSLLFGLLAGVIVDHLDKRRVLILCDIVRAVLVLGLFFVFQNPFLVYGLLFVHALLTQFYVPAEAPMIPRLIPQTMLVTANSLFSFTYYSSVGLGFILAGPFLRVFGAHVTFIIISTLFVVASFFVSLVPKQQSLQSFTSIMRKDFITLLQKVLRDVREGLAYVSSSKKLFDALLLLTGTQIILTILGTLGPGFADRVLEIDVRDASIYITAPVVIGIIVGALWVGSIGYQRSKERLIRTGIFSAGTILMIISIIIRFSRVVGMQWIFDSFLRLPLLFLLFFLLGVANSLLDVPSNSILQSQAQGTMRSRIYGMLTAAVGGIGILPVIAGGVLADAIGVGKVIFSLGFVITLFGLYRLKRYNT